MIGQTLSHYKITAKLGEGGMGEVYRAEDTTLDREVALKVLPAELADDPERLARFEREAKTLAALDHPNIVHIYSVESGTVTNVGAGLDPAQERTVRFLTMQLVEGRPLTTTIPTGGLPLERIFEFGIPLTEALAAAHDKGIVHRDLKPDNIMVTDEGRVKVLDFGLAKLQQVGTVVETTAAPTEVLTGEGRILGTMPYMSPEQLEGKDLDSRSDIFSLGILLYEMATGTRPFQGDTSVSLISSIVKDTPPSVDTVRDELPHHLARIVNRCLEKAPKRRYQSATDVYNELDGLKREVDSGIVSSGSQRPTTAEREAATAELPRTTSPPTTPSSAEAETPSPAQPAVPPVVPSGPPSGTDVSHAPAAPPAPARKMRWIGLIPVVVMALLVVYWLSRGEDSAPTPSESTSVETDSKTETDTTVENDLPAIVVLPFQNRGQSEDEFFADGMSEEITTRLAGISGLRVVSSTSAMQYKGDRPPLEQIAAELDVDYVLDGSVRWAKGDDGSRVRITPQLVRTSDDSQMWAESYDRVMEDVFEMQSEIAAEVVAQLGITLLEPEREELETRPTENLEAYQAFLRARYGQESSAFSEPVRRQVIEDLEKAVELDPDFILAWAALARAHSFYYRLGYDFTENRRNLALKAYDRAFALAPDSPEVLFAIGHYHYYVEQDFDAALEKFLMASEAQPQDADILAATAFVWRRQGKLSEGLERLERAFELSPRNAQLPALMGEFAQILRDYRDSVEYFDTSIGLAPEEYWPYVEKVQTLWLWKDDLTEARRVLDAAPGSGKDTPLYILARSEVARFDRDFRQVLAIQDEAPFEWYSHQSMSYPKGLLTAEAFQLMGDDAQGQFEYEKARIELESALADRSDDYRLHSSMGLALAGLGQRQEAIAAGKKAQELMPIETDLYIGSQFLYDLALTHARLGEIEKALDQIDLMLSVPSKFSVTALRNDPRWDGLREHPRYQELIEKYS